MGQKGEQAMSSRSPASRHDQAAVDKYLLPREVRIAAVRQHPAILVPAFATAFGGLAAALAVNGFADHDGLSQIAAWIVAAFFIGRLAITVGRWRVSYAVITDERFLIITGVFSRRVQSMGIDALGQMIFERSFFGRLARYGTFFLARFSARLTGYGAFGRPAGYGTFIIDSGISQLAMDGVPYSEEFYLAVTDLLFSGREEDYDNFTSDNNFMSNNYNYDDFDDPFILDDAPTPERVPISDQGSVLTTVDSESAPACRADETAAEEEPIAGKMAREKEDTPAAPVEDPDEL